MYPFLLTKLHPSVSEHRNVEHWLPFDYLLAEYEVFVLTPSRSVSGIGFFLINTAFAAFIKFEGYQAAAIVLCFGLVPGLLLCTYLHIKWLPFLLDSTAIKPAVPPPPYLDLLISNSPRESGALQLSSLVNAVVDSWSNWMVKLNPCFREALWVCMATSSAAVSPPCT